LANPARSTQIERRRFIKGGALATGAFFVNSKFNHLKLANAPSSPFTTPFIQPLAFAPYKVPLPVFAPLDPLPDFAAHQRYDEFPAVDFYKVDVCEKLACAHPQLAACPHTAYDGLVPGPTFMMRYGRPVMVRYENCMPPSMPNFGSCDISTHVHNGHHAPESDGGPWNLYSPGNYRDSHYANIYSGGDPLEAKGTLFYHDHCHDFTGPNVYRGLAGFFLLFDDLDSGNENDPNPDAFRLPSGVPDGKRVRNRYDIPIVLADRMFDQNGNLFFDQLEMDGILGDKYLVNGRVQPYFEVERRKYRFRILNSGISRFHDVWFSNGMTFEYIANDGNMLPAPMTLQNITLGVAERADIIVDFSQLPATTTEIYLVNRAEQTNGRGPTGNTLPMAQAPKMLKLIIRPGAVADNSRVPTSLRPLPAMDLPVARERSFHFDRSNGMWTVNGQLFDENRCDAACKIDTAEIWHFSTAGGWAHPVHNHILEPRWLTRNGQPVAGTIYQGRKDAHPLYAGDQVSVYMKFRDFLGRYPMHCHNLTHEDHAMMFRWDIVP
jgi:FtsP/CotA-like multicopper oxidase with cupredoxin domain